MRKFKKRLLRVTPMLAVVLIASGVVRPAPATAAASNVAAPLVSTSAPVLSTPLVEPISVCGGSLGEFDPDAYLPGEVPVLFTLECPEGQISCGSQCCAGVCCNPRIQVCCDVTCIRMCLQAERCPACT